MEWLLEIALVVLLAATLFHAVRLERALGVLKRDRVALEELVAGFNASTQRPRPGIERLRAAADGAGRQIARQVDAAAGAEGRPDAADRAWRPAGRPARRAGARRPAAGAERAAASSRGRSADAGASRCREEPTVRSQAERDLLKALRMAR